MSAENNKQKLFYDDMKDVLKQHGDALVPLDMLALAAHLVGTLLALQNPEHISSEQALAIVQCNMEAGNREALEQLEATTH